MVGVVMCSLQMSPRGECLRENGNTTNSSHSLFALPEGPMADRRSRSVSSRKQPQQARSNELVAAILNAAVQVLAKEGAQRFTTARVAERAGVSVGSLYQYFPNKAAILFRLQSDEWRRTSELLAGILAVPPPERDGAALGRAPPRNPGVPGNPATGAAARAGPRFHSFRVRGGCDP